MTNCPTSEIVNIEDDLLQLQEEGVLVVLGEESSDDIAEILATKCSRCGNSGNCSGSCNG